MKITIKDTDKAMLNFVHIKSKEKGTITADRNPLTGDWLRHEKVGDNDAWYYSDKTALKHLLNTIITKNKAAGLQADLIIEKNEHPVIPN